MAYGNTKIGSGGRAGVAGDGKGTDPGPSSGQSRSYGPGCDTQNQMGPDPRNAKSPLLSNKTGGGGQKASGDGY